ncbi:MAG: toxin-antitoxin system YwqK family antitoxin [Roseibacillus sp.]|nr:toxin-antitoxin system YwqK family antitoxin [Roseibacillus sp.]
MKKALLLFAALLVVGCGEKSLSDSKVKKLLEEAVEIDSLQERDALVYRVNESEPYSGWAKEMYDSGQVKGLAQFKDGKPDGLQAMWYENGQKSEEYTYKDGKYDGLGTNWYENGQKKQESTYKDGKEDGLRTQWRENGQKWLEKTFKDGAWLGGSEKYWNSKGEEVEARKEAQGSDSTGENPSAPNQTEEPSADTAKSPPAETPVAESPSESPTPPSEDAKPSADSPKPLISDADVERLVKEAIDYDSIERRDYLLYPPNESEPFSGWAKVMYDSGQVESLMEFRDGRKVHHRRWQENGQKKNENTWKDGEVDGLQTSWHENGQKWTEQTYKDGRWISAKFWNSKGEEVETYQESQK